MTITKRLVKGTALTHAEADANLDDLDGRISAHVANTTNPHAVTLAQLGGAPLASPTFTGTPVAPTAAEATNTMQLATTAHVFAERSNAATLTNKTIDGAANTLTNIPQAAMPTLATSLSLKSDFLAPVTEAASFALTSAHANRLVKTTAAAPVTFTCDTGHGLVDGDSGTILQVGAGTCSYTAGTAASVTGPAVTTVATTAQGSYIDWIFANGLLYLVARGVAPAAVGGSGATQAFTNAVAFTTLAASQTDAAMGTIKIAGQALTAKGQAYLRFKLQRTGTANPSFFVHVNGTLMGTFALTGDGGFANFPSGQLMLRGNGTDQTTLLAGNSAVWDFADRTISENPAATVNTANDWIVTLSGTTPAACTLAILSAVVEVITPQALA